MIARAVKPIAARGPARKVKKRSTPLGDPLLGVEEYRYDGPTYLTANEDIDRTVYDTEIKMPTPNYGPVLITGGPHKGRIGAFDNQEGIRAFVYFGHPLFALGYHLISARHLSPVSTVDLMRRLDEIYDAIGMKARASGPDWRPHAEDHIELLAELAYVQHEITERLFKAQFSTVQAGCRIFISHASEDKPFARLLAMDLADRGHRPWLDEWKILAGESIPSALSEGLDSCDFVVVVLSEHAVESKWVEREWQAKYWDEANSGKLHVIPALHRHCKIPTLLRSKKYADFTNDHNEGLEAILLSITRRRRKHSRK